MSIATFSEDLKIFSAEDNYSLPLSVSFSPGTQNHGAVSWSGDGKWLVVAPLYKGTGPLPVFKYENNHLQAFKYITLSNISSASFFNCTNRNLVIGNEKGEVFVWDIKEKKIAIKVEHVESQSVDFITVNADDNYVASASLTSNKICLHGLKTNKVVNTVSIPKSKQTSSLKWCFGKKNYLGASSIESTVCVWDILRSEFVFKDLKSHSGACTGISFSPVNYYVIASVSLTKTLKMYDLREGKSVLDANIGEPLSCVDIILDGEKVALGTTSGNVIIYDLRASKVFQTFKAHTNPILSLKMQNLNIPKSYEEVEMSTADTIEKASKTLDISVMDIFSPINVHTRRSVSFGPFNKSKSVSSQPSPKYLINNAENTGTCEDSFLKKILSPLPLDMIPKSQSSPYLCPITEKVAASLVEKPNLDLGKDLTLSEVVQDLREENKTNGGGDGFHVDDVFKRNLYYSDIVSEIKNCQKEVLNEISVMRKEVSEIKNELDSKFKLLQENYETLSEFLKGEVKQEIYAGNCDSKIEHISQRILINELNKLISSSGEQISEEIKLNAFRLKHIYEMLSGIK